MRNTILLFTVICIALTANADLFAQDSSGVHLIGQIDYGWSRAFSVVTQDEYAYMAVGYSGLRILDISDPDNPTEVGYCVSDDFEMAHDVAVAGDYAYVAWGNVKIIDISDPSNPQVVGTFSHREMDAIDITIYEGYLIATSYTYGFFIIDIADPADPSLTGSFESPGWARGADVTGHYAYLADWSDIINTYNAVRVIDLSNPANPREVGDLRLPGRHCGDVIISSDIAYVAGLDCGLRILDISNRTRPREISALDDFIGVRDVAVADDIIYAVDGNEGLLSVDVSDPASPELVSTFDWDGSPNGVAVSGNYVYIADQDLGLKVIDVSEPDNPHITGSYMRIGFTPCLDVSGDYAYVVLSGGGRYLRGGLDIVDISDPTNPNIVGRYLRDERFGEALTRNVAVSNGNAYITGFRTGISLHVVNVSDPANPIGAGEYFPHGRDAFDVSVSGDYAYLTANLEHAAEGECYIIDVSDPDSLQESATVDMPSYAFGIAIADQYVYVGGYFDGLQIVDVTNPQEPVIVSSVEIPHAYHLAVSDHYAYVASFEDGLYIIDITDPVDPVQVGIYDPPVAINKVYVVGNYAFLVCEEDGLRIINVENPEHPYEVGYYDTPGLATDVKVVGNLAFVADWASMRIFDCSEALGVTAEDKSSPTEYILLFAYPNPFNNATVIRFDLPKVSYTSLKVFNIYGAEVAELVDRRLTFGRHSVIWDAEMLPTGVYLVRMEASGFSAVRKLTLLR